MYIIFLGNFQLLMQLHIHHINLHVCLSLLWISLALLVLWSIALINVAAGLGWHLTIELCMYVCVCVWRRGNNTQTSPIIGSFIFSVWGSEAGMSDGSAAVGILAVGLWLPPAERVKWVCTIMKMTPGSRPTRTAVLTLCFALDF